MHRFPSCQGNANKTHNEITPDSSENNITCRHQHNNCYFGCGGKDTLIHCRWEECKLLKPLCSQHGEFSGNSGLIRQTTNDPTAGNISRENEICIQERDIQLSTYSSTIHHGKELEITQMPINGGMDKEIVIQLFYGILLSITKEWNIII